jgi:hypothetical protein
MAPPGIRLKQIQSCLIGRLYQIGAAAVFVAAD